jgi:hypothetical protein
LTGEHARTADAVAARGRAEQDDKAAGLADARAGDPLRGDKAHAHRVHEGVVRVGVVKKGVPADGRDAHAVAVVPDAGDGAAESEARLAEPQPVEQRDRSRSHRDNVAEDPADSGRGALERLDRGRMVVALDFERDRLAFRERHDACVLAGPLQDTFTFGGQPPQQLGRMFVGAVLRPQEREDGQLEVVRVPAEELFDVLQLAVGEAERAMERLLTGCRNRAQRRDSR